MSLLQVVCWGKISMVSILFRKEFCWSSGEFKCSRKIWWKILSFPPHFNHFRPVEANANKFPDINKSRNRIPSFFLPNTSREWWGESLWRWSVRYKCEWPLGKMFGQRIKAWGGKGVRRGVVVVINLSLSQPFQPHLFLSFTTCRNQIFLELQMIPSNV